MTEFKFEKSKDRYVTKIGTNNVEYEIFKILDQYDPSLKQKSIPWDFKFPPANLNYIATSMIKTMVRAGGVGLAANQVGLPWSFFSMGGLDGKVWFIVNPKITKMEGAINKDQEGCLSALGLFLPVPRSHVVHVEYTDFFGKPVAEKFEGLTARIFQHEYDHLQGTTFVDKVSQIVHERAKKKVKENMERIREIRKNAPPISDPKAVSMADTFQVEYTIKP